MRFICKNFNLSSLRDVPGIQNVIKHKNHFDIACHEVSGHSRAKGMVKLNFFEWMFIR